MAMPVMVRVETKVTQTGIMPVSWQTSCTLGPVHLLKRISTRVIGETTVQRSRSLTARFTINMLLTCKNKGDLRYWIGLPCSPPPSLPPSVGVLIALHCAGIQFPPLSLDRVTELGQIEDNRLLDVRERKQLFMRVGLYFIDSRFLIGETLFRREASAVLK